jgi:hypothetical protein
MNGKCLTHLDEDEILNRINLLPESSRSQVASIVFYDEICPRLSEPCGVKTLKQGGTVSAVPIYPSASPEWDKHLIVRAVVTDAELISGLVAIGYDEAFAMARIENYNATEVNRAARTPVGKWRRRTRWEVTFEHADYYRPTPIEPYRVLAP